MLYLGGFLKNPVAILPVPNPRLEPMPPIATNVRQTELQVSGMGHRCLLSLNRLGYQLANQLIRCHCSLV